MSEIANVFRTKQEEILDKKKQESIDVELLRRQKELKQEGLQRKIQNLLGKTRKKLRIKGLNREEKFNEKLKQLSKLDTFVNIQQTLTQMNLLDDPVIVKQINLLKEKMKQKEDQEEKKQQEKRQSQLEILQLEQDDEFYDKSKFILHLSPEDVSLEARKKKYLSGLQQINTLRLIESSKQRYIQSNQIQAKRVTDNEFEELLYQTLDQQKQIRNGIDEPFNEGYNFFEKTMDGLKKQQFQHKIKEVSKQKKDTSNQNEQYEQLYKFFVSNGIVFGNTEFIPNENYFKTYHQKASMLIKQAEEQSKFILNDRPGLLDQNQIDLQSRTKELVKQNREIFHRHRFISRKIKGVPKRASSQAAIEEVQEPESPSLKNSPPKIQSKKQSFAQSLEPMKRSLSVGMSRYFNELKGKINYAQTLFHLHANENLNLVKNMNAEIENSERKYSTNHMKSLQLDSEQMNNYLKLTQKIRENNLFKKKGHNQQQLRRQKLFKTRFN